MAHNSTTEFTKFTPFEATDTLRKMSIHAYQDAVAYLYCNLKDSMPEILKLSESGLEPTGYLPEYGQDDSTDVMRFHYNIPYKNNYEGTPGLYAFTNRYQGKEGDYILPYEIVYVHTDLVAPEDDDDDDDDDQTAIGDDQTVMNYLQVWPNPAGEFINIRLSSAARNSSVWVYNIIGEIQMKIEDAGKHPINIGDLHPGVYLIKDSLGHTSRFIKE
jgi:hypothetical protein